jgi:hypothetical protein
MNKLQIFPKAVMVIGIAFVIAGLVAAGAGIYTQSFVVQQLSAQNVTTPDDASIPNAPVNSIETALSMANIIQHHAAADLVGDFGATRNSRQVENLEQVGSLERGKPSSVTER